MFSFIKKKERINSLYKVENTILLDDIIRSNRATSETVPLWLTDDILRQSYYNYGVPDFLKPIISLPIGQDKTYTDLIAYYSRIFDKVNYLELGVSVGKNFYQLANQFSNAHLTGFDIENINPILEENFNFSGRDQWDTKSGSIRLEKSTVSHYNFKRNNIAYVAGDIWDENCWARLQGNRFNIIFSDALHDPKALLWEYKMIKKYTLLADSFIFIWDDLNNGLEESFFIIAREMRKAYKFPKHNIVLGKVNGWCGIHEGPHDVGIVSSVNLH